MVVWILIHISGWESRWPRLADCLPNEETVQGGALLVKSRITLPALDQGLDTNSLKTHLVVRVRELCLGEVSVLTCIYSMGQKVLELINPIPHVQTGKEDSFLDEADFLLNLRIPTQMARLDLKLTVDGRSSLTSEFEVE